MRLESVRNAGGYTSIHINGKVDKGYVLKDDSQPKDLKEIKILGMPNGSNLWVELARLGDVSMPFHSHSINSGEITYSEENFKSVAA